MRDENMPAFPVPCDSEGNSGRTHEQGLSGMSLRDYFAGQALSGMVIDQKRFPSQYAHLAYQVADEMLRQRQE